MPILSASMIALLICVISAILEGLFAGKGVKAFITNLRTPSYAPPFWVWLIIGVFYYVISFLISYRVLRHSGDSLLKAVSLTLLLAMMSINAVWNYMFFRAQNLSLSFFAFIPYPLLAIALFVCLLQFEPLAAWILLPYLAYLNYAAFICYKYWRLNEHPSQSIIQSLPISGLQLTGISMSLIDNLPHDVVVAGPQSAALCG